MKNRLIYIVIAILFIGLFLIGWYSLIFLKSTANIKIDKSETARLSMDGSMVRVLSSTRMYNLDLVFLDAKTNAIVSTLSVDNPVLEPPSYFILKGHTHDWLVVTRANSGTGFINRYYEWYILKSSGNMKMVLQHLSQGYKLPDENGNNFYWQAEVDNKSSFDDSVVNIAYTLKECSIAENGEEKECLESLRTDHYTWDKSNEEFVVEE